MESTGISSVRHHIAFQWNLKVKDIPRYSPFRPGRLKSDRLVSKTYRLSDIKDMFFYFEVDDARYLHIKGHSRWSFEFAYAFAVFRERAFSVRRFEKLNFLEHLGTLEESWPETEISYHCMIVAQPAAVSKDAESDSDETLNEKPKRNEERLKEDEKLKRQYVEFDGNVDSERRFDGEIPDFTIGMAKHMVPKYSNTNRVLKILAVEYLMANLTAQNVSGILEIAVNAGIAVLQKRCVDFLIKSCTVNSL